ncbi:MAG: hypothetical protein OXJ53_17970 [Gammaproteobacteria bacterium]|nr:hypothetical protein [Gammaproteobacteria bacterium]MDE0271192.1 hypothetical protein [Gammaproteobacteria bacterium]
MSKSSDSFEQLVAWMVEDFKIAESYAYVSLTNLMSTGLLCRADDGVVRLESVTRQWLDGGEKMMLIAAMHCRTKFVGEVLQELRDPKSVGQLRQVAGRYGLHWKKNNQVKYRIGWLASADLIDDASGRLMLLPDGEKMLDQLEIYRPSGPVSEERSNLEEPPRPRLQPTEGQQSPRLASTSSADELASEIREASTDSDNPTRFECAVRDGFQFMGFLAEHFGGSGKTDVLLTAPLGLRDEYRVTVDAKTTSSGTLKDPQVDWQTLVDHRAAHNAKYSLLVAPNPRSDRLLNRAELNSVGVMSAEQLAALCQEHGQAPLSLADYEDLFRPHGKIDPKGVQEKQRSIVRLRKLASAIWRQLPEITNRKARPTVGEIYMALPREATDEIDVEAVQELLKVLSHPLIGVVYDCGESQSNDRRYVWAGNREALRQRLDLFTEEFLDGEARTPKP